LDSASLCSWRAGTSNRVSVPARQAVNRFLGSLKGLQTRALIVSAQSPNLSILWSPGLNSLEAIPGLLKIIQIRAKDY
jgi:hypothetical protein